MKFEFKMTWLVLFASRRKRKTFILSTNLSRKVNPLKFNNLIIVTSPLADFFIRIAYFELHNPFKFLRYSPTMPKYHVSVRYSGFFHDSKLMFLITNRVLRSQPFVNLANLKRENIPENHTEIIPLEVYSHVVDVHGFVSVEYARLIKC